MIPNAVRVTAKPINTPVRAKRMESMMTNG